MTYAGVSLIGEAGCRVKSVVSFGPAEHTAVRTETREGLQNRAGRGRVSRQSSALGGFSWESGGEGVTIPSKSSRGDASCQKRRSNGADGVYSKCAAGSPRYVFNWMYDLTAKTPVTERASSMNFLIVSRLPTTPTSTT